MKIRIVRCFAVVFTLAALAYMAVSTGQARNANAADSSGGTGIVTSPSLDTSNSTSGDSSTSGTQSNSGSQSAPAAPAAGGCCG